MWSGKHDGDLTDSFDWQDQIGEVVAGDVLGVILQTEGEKLRRTPEEDLTAEQLFLFGKLCFRDQSKHDFTRSIRYHDLAIRKDPTLAVAYASALLHTMGSQTLRYESTKPYVAKIPGWIEAARGLPSTHPGLDLTIAVAEYLTDFDPTKLRPVVEHTPTRAPFDVEVLLFCGWSNVWMGAPLPALDHFAAFRKLGRLSPYWNVALAGAANASVQAGRFEDAITIARQAISQAPDNTAPYNCLASACAHLGRMEEAREAVRQIQRIEPGVSVSNNRAVSNYGGTPEGERYLEGLVLAGLPE